MASAAMEAIESQPAAAESLTALAKKLPCFSVRHYENRFASATKS
jgi:hypothetical protein